MANSNGIAGFLVMLSHPELPQKVAFNFGNNIIGRSQAKADVVIKEASISQKHARLIVSDNGLKLVDLGSKNGTKINSEDNLLKKDEQFAVDETMVIYLAEVKCKIQLNKSKEIKPEQKKPVQVKGKVKKRQEVMQMFEDESRANLAKKQIPIKQQVEKKKIMDQFKKPTFQDIQFEQKIEEVKQIQVKPQIKKKQTKKGKGKPIESKNSIQLEQKIDKKEDKKPKQTKQKKDQKKQLKQPSQQKKMSEQKSMQRSASVPPPQQSIKEAVPPQQQTKEVQVKNNKQKERKKSPQNKNKKFKPQKKISIPTNSVKDDKSSKPSISKLESRQQELESKFSAPQVIVYKKGRKSMASKDQKAIIKSKQPKKNKSSSPQKKKQPINIKVSKPSKKSTGAERQNMNMTVGNIENQSARTAKKLRKRRLSESLDRNQNAYRENRLIPPRRQKIGRRVLISGFTCIFERNLFKIVEDYNEPFDYLIMRSYTRTFKALIAICRGILIVSQQWIRMSESLMQPMSAKSFRFKDIDFVYQAIEKVSSGLKVFDEYQFFLASSQFHMEVSKVKELLHISGGKVLPNTIKSIPKEKKAATIAIVCNQTKDNQQQLKMDIKSAKKLGFDKVYTIEFVLDSCQKQKINWSENSIVA